jgi:hypothetical protein
MLDQEGNVMYDDLAGQRYLDSKVREWVKARAKVREDWLWKVLPEVMPREDIQRCIDEGNAEHYKKHGIMIVAVEYSEFPFDAMTVMKTDDQGKTNVRFSKLFPR